MKKLHICVLTFIFCSFIALKAQNERIYLKNGSVIVGYISQQIPSENVIITSSQAIVYQNGKEIRVQDKKIPFDELSQNWKDWALENQAVEEQNGKKVVLLSEVIDNSDTILAKILEKGSIVKYQTFTQKEYCYKWSDIEYYAKDRRPITLLSGLNDVVILKDKRRFVGQILENHPGEIIKMATNKDIVEVFNYSEINALCKEKLNNDQSIWEQSFLIDELSLKDSTEKIKGIIIEQILEKEVCLEKRDGSKCRIAISNILIYEKKNNLEYQPKEDVILQKGELKLNEKLLQFQEIPVINNLVIIDQENPSGVINTDEDVVIYANLEDTQTLITIFKARTQYEKTGFLGLGKKEKHYEIFSYEDILKKGIPFTKYGPTDLGTTKIVFKVKEKGFYVVYIKGYEGFIVLKTE